MLQSPGCPAGPVKSVRRSGSTARNRFDSAGTFRHQGFPCVTLAGQAHFSLAASAFERTCDIPRGAPVNSRARGALSPVPGRCEALATWPSRWFPNHPQTPMFATPTNLYHDGLFLRFLAQAAGQHFRASAPARTPDALPIGNQPRHITKVAAFICVRVPNRACQEIWTGRGPKRQLIARWS